MNKHQTWKLAARRGKKKILSGFLSTGKHISRAEVKENRNIWLEFRLVLIMVLSKDYLNSYSQKYLPVFFHVKCYKSKGNGYCKKSWKYIDEFSTEHPKSWKCHIPLNSPLLAPSMEYFLHGNCSHTQIFAVAFFVRGKLLQNIRFFFSLAVQYANTLHWCTTEPT